jgi:hypothetical protein
LCLLAGNPKLQVFVAQITTVVERSLRYTVRVTLDRRDMLAVTRRI